MLRKLDSIKGCGNFLNYTWDADLTPIVHENSAEQSSCIFTNS